jgi:hypothetical protein
MDARLGISSEVSNVVLQRTVGLASYLTPLATTNNSSDVMNYQYFKYHQKTNNLLVFFPFHYFPSRNLPPFRVNSKVQNVLDHKYPMEKLEIIILP